MALSSPIGGTLSSSQGVTGALSPQAPQAPGQPDYSKPPPGWTDPGGGWGDIKFGWNSLSPEQRQGVWQSYQSSPPGQEAKSLASYKDKASQMGQEYQAASGSPEDVSRYYGEMSAPIESNFYNQANQVSAYLARQGLGSSGMNLGAHAQLEGNRSALESQAKKTAIDEAINKERQGILENFAMNASGEQLGLQKYGIDTSMAIAQMQMQAQMKMLQEQMNAQMMGGIGGLVGTGLGLYLGGPMGAMAGGQAGSALGKA